MTKFKADVRDWFVSDDGPLGKDAAGPFFRFDRVRLVGDTVEFLWRGDVIVYLPVSQPIPPVEGRMRFIAK